MDSLLLIQTFREVALRGSFSAAAKSLGQSRANASKYVAELERRFAVRLFHRSTRSVSLTDAGALLLERSEPLLDLVDTTRQDLATRTSQPSGRLRVSAVASLADGPVQGILTAFAQAHPLVHLSCEFTNRRVDLIEEAVDLVLRAGRIVDSELIVKRLAMVPFMVVASPGYWRAHGVPTHPDQLSQHAALVYTQENSAKSGHSHWAFMVDGKLRQVPISGRLDSTNGDALASFACAGLGVAYLPAVIALEFVDQGLLVPALPGFMPQDTWLYAAYANRRNNSAALTALLAALEAGSNTIKIAASK